MLTIQAHASGSSGNCYTVTDGRATVMLDCGLPFREIQKLVGHRLPDAVLVTHEHKDHSRAVEEFLRRGVDVYMTRGTAEALGIRHHRAHIVKDRCIFALGNGMTASVFQTQHDAAEPCGFVLEGDGDKILYATDTYYLRYRFPGLTKLMVEANHSYDILQENVEARRLDRRLAMRLAKSHFSIENVLDFLMSNDLSRVSEIWLIHLSKDNADPELFRRMVQEATGKPVHVAGTRGGGFDMAENKMTIISDGISLK